MLLGFSLFDECCQQTPVMLRNYFTKVCSLLEHSCAILMPFKIVVIFNITSADFVLMSADVVLKMTTILKGMRIVQLCSKSERTLHTTCFG